MTSGQTGSPRSEAEVPLGVALKRLRQKAGLTGQELGRRVGMSQAKISKIETGAMRPSVEDVEQLARELGVPPASVEQLTDRVENARDRMTDWRFGRDDPASWQREVEELEAEATELRSFQPAVLSGLLQTSEYARAVLGTVWESLTDSARGPSSGVAEAVSVRVHRQQILDDRTKQFHFVMPETVLHNLLCPPEEMPGQLRRILEVSQQDNVKLSMVPADAR
jgi:transcriptional regulator with XRE-family HTH domain